MAGPARSLDWRGPRRGGDSAARVWWRHASWAAKFAACAPSSTRRRPVPCALSTWYRIASSDTFEVTVGGGNGLRGGLLADDRSCVDSEAYRASGFAQRRESKL